MVRWLAGQRLWSARQSPHLPSWAACGSPNTAANELANRYVEDAAERVEFVVGPVNFAVHAASEG